MRNEEQHRPEDQMEVADALIERIRKEQVEEMFEGSVDLHNLPLVDDSVRQRFLAAVQAEAIAARDPRRSQVERWLRRQKRTRWLDAVQKQWASFQASLRLESRSLEHLLQPLRTALEEVSLQPAPVMRSASPAAEFIVKPRRRTIDAADLPIFPSLFCTALSPAAGPMLLKGLTSRGEYELTLRCVQEPGWQHQEVLAASPGGELALHFAERLRRLQDQYPQCLQFAWFLRELSTPAGGWSSGMIWLEQESNAAPQREVKLALDEARHQIDQDLFQRLFEISILISWEKYIQAYERTRKLLLFSPNATPQELLPVKEILWHFIATILSAVIRQLEPAAPVFRELQPDWNVLEPLYKLHESVKGRE